jgi:hypothetical protein
MAMFNNTCPSPGDTSAILWKKIVQVLSEQNGGTHPPKPLDWKYQSLVKVAKILAGCN